MVISKRAEHTFGFLFLVVGGLLFSIVEILWRYYYTGEQLDEENSQRSMLNISSIYVLDLGKDQNSIYLKYGFHHSHC